MNLLVTTEELAAHLNDPDWVIFDTRHDLGDTEMGRHAYAEDHIPGAFFLHLDDDLSGPKNGRNGRHPLPDQRAFSGRMAALGVARGKHAVVYDDAGGMVASRLWWMLRWLGMERVALLDGGYPKWLAEGRQVTAEVPVPVPGRNDFVLQAGKTVDAEFVLSHLGDGASVVLDARAPERYRGEQEPLDPVAGHIPGAVNRPFKSNLNADGTFRAADQLCAEYLELLNGRAPGQMVHQCGSGITACHNLFAMELVGLTGSRLYPGSWSEWVADRSRPVVLGA
jgi:thiosulfate/3-mercaptopyruvate sulfurtransferase